MKTRKEKKLTIMSSIDHIRVLNFLINSFSNQFNSIQTFIKNTYQYNKLSFSKNNKLNQKKKSPRKESKNYIYNKNFKHVIKITLTTQDTREGEAVSPVLHLSPVPCLRRLWRHY